MAKNDAKILANPSSKLYPILIRKLKLVANPAESVEEVKENISLNELKSAPVAKPKVAKNNLTLSKPLQPKPIMANSKKIAKVVDNIVKPTAAVLYSPRQSSMSKSRKIIISLVAAKKKPQPPMLQPHQPKRSLNPPISNSVFNDFVVPKLDSPNPTRTGLVQKSKKSDLESMRQESDDRLKIAMKHLIIARKVISF